MKQDIDYTYSKQVFDCLEQTKIGDVPLLEYFVVDGNDYWQFYRQRAFEDIKEFSQTRVLPPTVSQSFGGVLKDCVIHIGMLLMGVCTYGIAIAFQKRILIYGIDKVNAKHGNDFRMTPVYDFLEEKHLPYSELLHTVVGRQVFQNFLSRKRPAMYLETWDWIYGMCVKLKIIKPYRVVDTETVQIPTCLPHEEILIRKSIVRYVYQMGVSRFKVAILAFIFRHAPFTTLYMIDDARYYYEVLLAARMEGLKSYAFQHGHFTKYHVGWLKNSRQCGTTVHPDKLLVWSEYWKGELLRLGSATPADAIRVGGGKDVGVGIENRHTVSEECITILIPYETSCPKTEVAAYIGNMLCSRRIRVIFKLRPDMEESVQLAEYGLEHVHDPNFLTAKEIQRYIGEVDVVAGVYSTFLYDMIAVGKRVAILETSSDYGEGMCVNGLADMLKKSADIYESLQSIRTLSPEIIEKRRRTLVQAKTSLKESLEAMAVEHNVIKK